MLYIGGHLQKILDVSNTAIPKFYFNGMVDDFVLSSRGFTKSEVLALMERPFDIVNLDPAIVLYYSFDLINCDLTAGLKDCDFNGDVPEVTNYGVSNCCIIYSLRLLLYLLFTLMASCNAPRPY
jgi:hypothetical protein